MLLLGVGVRIDMLEQWKMFVFFVKYSDISYNNY